MALKIVLGEGVKIGVSDYTSNSFIADNLTFQEAVDGYNRLSGNTGAVQIKNEDETVLNVEELIMDGVQIMQNQAGSYTAFYYYHGAKAAETEKDEFATVGKILMGVEA